MNRDTLLVVDDMEINRTILRSLFESDYNILEAQNGEQALMLIHQYKDSIATVLLDIVMPVKDGYQVLSEMDRSGLLSTLPVIVVTSQDSSENELRAFDLGASDIIMKPFEPHVVRRRVQNVVELNLHKLHLEELVEEQAVNLRESKEVLMDALSSVIEHRSIESGQHVLRIRMFTKVLLEDVMHSYPEYGLDERKIGVIASAASLHDIGKIAIPDAILNKPGKLTPEEFAVMKTHAEKGCEILAGLDRMHDKEYLQYAYYICRYHHERFDGKGYPEGLKGENIPICAQVVGIADAYDALTTDRVYKKAYSPEKAYNMILNGECGKFSRRLLECFKNVRAAFVKLTRDYADGLSPKAGFPQAPLSVSALPEERENTLELGQMKYFAMLRYENTTVMEVDADSGVYHLVYKPNSDFSALSSGSLFEESYRSFLQGCVHPDDWDADGISGHVDDFLASGVMKQSWQYRVLHKASGEYVRYRVTALRISTEGANKHRLLLVWKELDPKKVPAGSCQDKSALMMENSLVGMLQCQNDQWFTILRINSGFTALLGYEKEELEHTFHNRFSELLHPDDRARVLQKFHEQINTGNLFELEYRIVAKDGRILWVLDKSQLSPLEDGGEYLSCVLTDISQSKQEREELRLSMERHQIIMDQTNDVLFEWDIRRNKIYYSSNWVKKYGYEPISEEISLKIPQSSHILPEDLPVFIKLMNDVGSGAPYGEAELRIAHSDGRYHWSRIRATTQFDNDGKPVKAVGVILDIDSEKRRTQDLIEKADRDTLTKLYNKSAAKRRIQLLMKQQNKQSASAMLIIDLDNFKLVNDTHGHLFGDAVLAEVALRIKRLFGMEDVVSRIGGDEFLVYIEKVSDDAQLTQQCARLVEDIQDALRQELQGCPISCSVGAARCPSDAVSFQELFQCCDRALYRAKALGKNRYVLYNKSAMDDPFGLEQRMMAIATTRIESDEPYDFETTKLVLRTFQSLYRAGDVEKAVQSVLKLVGRKYQVSRMYIFEESGDGRYCKNTFEWCGKGVSPEIDRLQHVSYEELGDFRDSFDVNGIFYCTDTSTLPKKQYELAKSQGIRAMLQCAIYDNGRFAGFVGADDCVGKRMWTQHQINALMFISELLSTFLFKKRVQDRLAESLEDLRTLLDNQNSWIYVINPDTYELAYINAKTCVLVPDAVPGMRCHEAFFKSETPCENCPAKDIRGAVNRTLEVYNPLLNVWTIADASLIRWGGKEACLLACHDVTQYKR